jgi:hypothetical protein
LATVIPVGKLSVKAAPASGEVVALLKVTVNVTGTLGLVVLGEKVLVTRKASNRIVAEAAPLLVTPWSAVMLLTGIVFV